MKKLLFALSFCTACSTPLFAETPPPGTYQMTCSGISASNDVLSATCVKLNGASQKTSLANLSACVDSLVPGGDIGNIDGNLICIPDIPKTDPGLRFPEAELTINRWIYGQSENDIYRHGWGIWAGLTTVAGKVDGAPIRAFESWATISNMLFRMQTPTALAAPRARPLGELDLKRPNQFRNMKALPKAQLEAVPGGADTNIFVSVAYNPPAAEHAIANKLFLKSSLVQFMKEGYDEIPNFPLNAITIKPVYKVIPKDTPNGIYTFPGWPGTPVPAKTFGESMWNSCVYVNINGSGAGGSSIDQGCKGRTAANTFYLNNFIYNAISAADANYLKTQLGINASAGDYAILVGMHVTSREIKRWTWQTFWWSANPDSPYSPSSKAIADLRPKQSLDAAAQHYAMSSAYQMVAPAQPIMGGQNVGAAHIAYNPYLEAGFDPSVFQIVRPINAGTSKEIKNEYGVQTNCMTCHNLASYDPKVDYSDSGNREKPYGTDYYMSLSDPVFAGKLRLDFAWSVLGALQLDK